MAGYVGGGDQVLSLARVVHHPRAADRQRRIRRGGDRVRVHRRRIERDPAHRRILRQRHRRRRGRAEGRAVGAAVGRDRRHPVRSVFQSPLPGAGAQVAEPPATPTVTRVPPAPSLLSTGLPVKPFVSRLRV